MPDRNQNSRAQQGKVRAGQMVILVVVMMALAWSILSIINALAPHYGGRGGGLITEKQLFKGFFPEQYDAAVQQQQEQRSQRQ